MQTRSLAAEAGVNAVVMLFTCLPTAALGRSRHPNPKSGLTSDTGMLSFRDVASQQNTEMLVSVPRIAEWHRLRSGERKGPATGADIVFGTTADA